VAELVVCIKNDGYEASLEVRKIYRTLDDTDAQKHGLLRVIDKSGDDYLYPRGNFLRVILPQSTRRAVLAAAKSGSRGFLAPSPHTTHRAGPQWAVQRVGARDEALTALGPGPCNTGL
jgi:hypothetical protein